MPPETMPFTLVCSIIVQISMKKLMSSCPRVGSREMATTLTWLGHAAFRIDTPAGTRIYVDPFLDGNPKCPDGEREPERCDLVVVTHGHDDHVGDAAALAERFSCPVVAQVEVRGWLSTQGLDADMSQSPNKGGTVPVRRRAGHAHGREPLLEHLRDGRSSTSASHAVVVCGRTTARRSTSRATPTCSATWR